MQQSAGSSDLWQLWGLAIIPLAVIYYIRNAKRYKFPPGPRPLPIVGNLNLLAQAKGKPHLMLTELSKKYGDVFSFKMGQNPAIVLSSLAAIKEGLVEHADSFSDRPKCLYIINRFINQKGIVFKSGPEWRDLRRFTLQTLRGFGLGRTSIEARIQQEAGYLVQQLATTRATPINPHTVLMNAVSNIICSIVFGDRFSYDDANFKKMMTLLTTLFRTAGFQNIENFVPWLRFIKPGSKKYLAEQQRIQDAMHDWVLEQVNQHRDTFDPDNMRDFVDLYLLAEKEGRNQGALSEENILRVVMDLYNAGTETTTTTLTWGLLILLRHPEVQDRCRQDILKVVGESGQLSVEHKKHLPYLEATICEIQRLANIGPLGVPHALSTDVEFRGYQLPRDTIVITNMHAVHKDPTHWPEPETFRPERFLDEDNNLTKPEAFLPFSIGKRACMGESLARTELFIFLGTLLQKFEFRPVDGETCPPVEGTQGISWSPLPYRLQAHML